ncbi:hypothetical protein RHSIM_Rhsim03G0009300 [Rhododendron simsii]|uniref:TBCC domain-containing protein 1 n=1 Tax=Rhododendron simsii TaxID=118357 RepID=A0A834LSU4_RHOSS|nr:hypothetical protein RHSIM_Rhsim03G0009300 [Rhododendron simsii]
MADATTEQPSTPSTKSSTKTTPHIIHPRREPFEHGLLPIPKLIFTDPTQTLLSLKKTLSHRVDSLALSEALQIPPDHARLIVDTIAAVHYSDCDIEAGGGIDVCDLILFLYVQSYKRLLPRTHKDSAAVADVWPSTSAFDGYLSALSPLQLVRSNSRRFVPSQSDEEVHQLSYLQKHLANILTLLADSVEGEGEESQVLTLEKFEHLEFLIYFGEKGSERIPLGQAAPFFANSDPEMPAAPVPASQVHDWLLENIASAFEHICERVPPKENGLPNASDQDVSMADASASSIKASTSARGTSFIEGISKSSYVKQTSDLNGSSVKVGYIFTYPSGIFIIASLLVVRIKSFVDMCTSKALGHVGLWSLENHDQSCSLHATSLAYDPDKLRLGIVVNCHDSVIYVLAPLRYATIYGCSDATIVLGAVGKAVRVEHCERVQVIVAAKRICIANCRECVFYLGVNQRPLIVGDNHKLQVAPYNTYYSQLEEHMNQVGIQATINKWDEPLALGAVDPHDSLSHPAGESDVQAESASRLDPDQFTNFLIPNWFEGESSGSTKDNPFPLPDAYMASQHRNHNNLGEIKQILRETQLEESRKRDLSSALHVYFKDWLYGSLDNRFRRGLEIVVQKAVTTNNANALLSNFCPE